MTTKIKAILACSIAMFILVACNSTEVKPKPDWINNPGDGAVGSCKTHVKGRHYQEELAIARARDRLAARYGVEVSSIQTINERVVNDSAYVRSDKEMQQTINKAIVKAHVRKMWLDKEHDELWVWVYPVND